MAGVDHFLTEEAVKPPFELNDVSSAILSDIVVHMKYAKYLPELGRRETWNELCNRNKEMHQRKYPDQQGTIEYVYKHFVKTKKVLPSMRSLQFGGLPIELSNNRIFNCAYLPAEKVSCFSTVMFLLLGGSGCGYSVQQRHVEQLPVVQGCNSKLRRFMIGDSIEGWADAVKVLTEAYFSGKAKPVFDYRDIREKGAELITTGGKAPGPAPLKACLEALESRLEAASGRSLTSIEVHDMICIIADAVLAGGIRRAALICLFDRNDSTMLNSKGKFHCEVKPTEASNRWELTAPDGKTHYFHTYDDDDFGREKVRTGIFDWYDLYPYRGRANNSAVLPRGEVTKEEFWDVMAAVEASGAGEPGVYWSSNTDWGTNPCCRAFCNLAA